MKQYIKLLLLTSLCANSLLTALPDSQIVEQATQTENALIDRAVQSLLDGFATDSMIAALPEAERPARLRKKAKRIQQRIIVLDGVKTRIDDTTLSEEHRQNIQKWATPLMKSFNLIDKARKKGAYDAECLTNSAKSTFVTDSIINAIVLSLKPIQELTTEEQIQKQVMKNRIEKTIIKLKLELMPLLDKRIIGQFQYMAIAIILKDFTKIL